MTFPNKDDHFSSFLWREEWINEFESPWSIFTKFHFFNCTNEKEFFQLFGNNDVKKLKGKLGEGYKIMYSLDSFDDQTLKKILGYSKESSELLNNMLLHPLKNTRNNGFCFMSCYLRLCPICLENKYHSTFHQFLFQKNCPFHNTPIVNECPKCKEKYSYSIFNPKFKSPYICQCGFTYASSKNVIKKVPYIRDKIFLEWISQDTNKQLKDLHFFSELNSSIFDYTENDFTYTVNDLLHVKKNRTIFKSRKNPDFINIHGLYNTNLFSEKSEWYNFSQFQEELFLITNTIMNSIARNLRKNLLKKHIHCIKKFTKSAEKGKFKGSCPYAIAYVYWRMRLQRYRSPAVVDNKGTVPLYRERISNFGFPVENGFYFLENLINERTRIFVDSDHKYYSLKWIVNRFVAEIVYADFKKCLIEANNYTKTEEINPDFFEGYSCIPKLIFFQIKEDPIQYGFYKTNSIKLDKVVSELVCPNS